MSKLSNTVLELVFAATWRQCKQVLLKHQSLLLTDDADDWLHRAAASYYAERKTSDDATDELIFPMHHALLRRCREIGIDKAFKEFEGESRLYEKMTEEQSAELAKFTAARRALRELFEADTMEKKEAIIEDQWETLLSDDCSELMANYMQGADEEFFAFLESHQLLLEKHKVIRS